MTGLDALEAEFRRLQAECEATSERRASEPYRMLDKGMAIAYQDCAILLAAERARMREVVEREGVEVSDV